MFQNSIAQPFKTKKSSIIECVIFSDVYNSKNVQKISNAEKLLVSIHDGMYAEHFPHKDEQEPVSVWIKTLELGDEKGKHVYLAFGKNLDSSDPQVMGFAVAGLYDKSGMLEYIIRTKEAACEIKGTEILEKTIAELNKLSLKINNEEIKYIYWELNDPEKVKYDENNPDPLIDCMSPLKRLELIKKRYGGNLLGIDYVQAPLTKEQNVCNNLRLLRIDMKELNLDESVIERNTREATELKAYLKSFIETLTEKKIEEYALKEPGIMKMFNQINLMIINGISPLEDRQSTIQKELLNACIENVAFNEILTMNQQSDKSEKVYNR